MNVKITGQTKVFQVMDRKPSPDPFTDYVGCEQKLGEW